MSRPIYEPSLPRADAELGYGNRQLFRRPAPIAGGDAVLPTFRAVLTENAIDQEFFDESPPAGNSGMENPTTLFWDAWDNGDPSIFIEHLQSTGTYTGYLANIEYTLPGIYLVNWRIDFDDFFIGWLLTAASYDREIYTKYNGCQTGANEWFYGELGFTEVRYWNPDDNYTDPSVEIILGQDSGSPQIVNGFGAWGGGTELIIVYLGLDNAQTVLNS